MLQEAGFLPIGDWNPQSTEDPEQIIIDVSNRQPGSLTGLDCPECLNRGYIHFLDANRNRAIRECRCMVTRRSMEIVRNSGLGDMVDRYTFDRYQTPEEWHTRALQMAREFAEDPQGWFAICGSVGAGKTHLCVAICSKLMKRGWSTRYMLWRDLSAEAKARLTDADGYQRLIDPLKRCRVLYIDDLFKTGKGAEPSQADVNLAFEILNARYNDADKITLISSELSIEEMLGIDQAVGSRIYERCRGRYIRLKDKKNWRLK